MIFFRYILVVLFGLVLTACGGGGGSSGKINGTTSGTTTTTTTIAAPKISLTVVDAAGNQITDHSLSQTRSQFLKVALTDSAGSAVPYGRVAVTLDSTIAAMSPAGGAQLTDQSGVTLTKISPQNVSASGVVTAVATASVNGVIASQSYSFQVSPGVVSLSGLLLSSSSIQNGQSINVSVAVAVNGVAAASNSVSVDFSSACGTFSPVSALVDISGKASSVMQSTNPGSCSVSASAVGGASVSSSYTVTQAPIVGLQFVSASPSLIYQKGSPGVNTSIVKFKVVDSTGKAVTTGIDVIGSFSNTDAGLDFCGLGTSPTLTSDSTGVVSFSVCGGSFPTTVQVHAVLAGNSLISTDSNVLTVQTGLPTQRFFDISAAKHNIYTGGYFTSEYTGNTTAINVNLADRQGNPVPDGTKVVFVAEGGQINSSGNSSCSLTNGSCSVNFIGQNYRPLGSSVPGGDPRPGRVTVLAYANGEESFLDKNNNNRWDSGESFEDLGVMYIDKDEDGIFTAAYTDLQTGTAEAEETYPLPQNPVTLATAAGTSACPTNSNFGLSVAGTCNGTWDGYTLVRGKTIIVFSGGEICSPNGYDASIPSKYRTATITNTASFVQVQLADCDGNPLPADATVAISTLPLIVGGTCAVANSSAGSIGSATEPTMAWAQLTGCSSGDLINIKVTVAVGSSSSKSSTYSVAIP